MNWYIVQAYSGFEKKVVESIKEELKKYKLEDNIGEILVPTHQVTQVKKGKRTKKESKYFPGYVLLKIELTKQIYHLIKNLTKVSGFLGSGDKPTPISDTEIQRILGQVSENADNQKTGISFEIGGTAITGGGITVTQSGSAAGDVDTAEPTAANRVEEDGSIEMITNGASSNAVKLLVTFVIRR